jgi:hypothetical protein
MSVINQDEWDNYCRVLRAWYEGNIVQYKNHSGSWSEHTNEKQPWFQPTVTWRIKPKTFRFKVSLCKSAGGLFANISTEDYMYNQLKLSPLYVKDLTDWTEVEI